jgi:hypothetical protein
VNRQSPIPQNTELVSAHTSGPVSFQTHRDCGILFLVSSPWLSSLQCCVLLMLWVHLMPLEIFCLAGAHSFCGVRLCFQALAPLGCFPCSAFSWAECHGLTGSRASTSLPSGCTSGSRFLEQQDPTKTHKEPQDTPKLSLPQSLKIYTCYVKAIHVLFIPFPFLPYRCYFCAWFLGFCCICMYGIVEFI